MRRFFLPVLLALIIFLPLGAAQAAEGDLAPEFNPLCFTQQECQDARAAFVAENKSPELVATDGWVQEDPCIGQRQTLTKEGAYEAKPLGKCLPIGNTHTSINFGGRRDFGNVGDFIVTIYNYLLGIAGILATITIIIAGVQWTTSAGNSEMITSAKNRISGAVVGLFIAYLSYTILYSINPALINLRLPQVWMVQKQSIIAEYCADPTMKDKLFAFATKNGQKVDPKKFSDVGSDDYKKMTDLKDQEKACGNQFFPSGGGGNTCTMSKCLGSTEDDPYMCAQSQKDTHNYQCYEGNVMAKVTYQPNFLSKTIGVVYNDWASENPVTKISIFAVCKYTNLTPNWYNSNPNTTAEVGKQVGEIIKYSDATRISIAKVTVNQLLQNCPESLDALPPSSTPLQKVESRIKGFLVALDFNVRLGIRDQTHFFDKNGRDVGILGSDILFTGYNFAFSTAEVAAVTGVTKVTVEGSALLGSAPAFGSGFLAPVLLTGAAAGTGCIAGDAAYRTVHNSELGADQLGALSIPAERLIPTSDLLSEYGVRIAVNLDDIPVIKSVEQLKNNYYPQMQTTPISSQIPCSPTGLQSAPK